MSIQISHLDHFVLTVADLDAAAAFYRDILGMEIITFDAGRVAVTFGSQKINLHPQGQDVSGSGLIARNVTPGSGDVCFIASTPLDEVIAHLNAQGVAIEAGPVERDGAQGRIMSVYFRDLDGNLIEVSNLVGT